MILYLSIAYQSRLYQVNKINRNSDERFISFNIFTSMQSIGVSGLLKKRRHSVSNTSKIQLAPLVLEKQLAPITSRYTKRKDSMSKTAMFSFNSLTLQPQPLPSSTEYKKFITSQYTSRTTVSQNNYKNTNYSSTVFEQFRSIIPRELILGHESFSSPIDKLLFYQGYINGQFTENQINSMHSRIRKHIQASTTLRQFILFEKKNIFLSLFKNRLKQYFSLLKSHIKNLRTRKMSDLMIGLLEKLQLLDFIILLVKSYTAKRALGLLLARNQLPIPVLTEVEGLVQYHPQLLIDIFKNSNFNDSKYEKKRIYNFADDKQTPIILHVRTQSISYEQKQRLTQFFNNGKRDKMFTSSFQQSIICERKIFMDKECIFLNYSGSISPQTSQDTLSAISHLASLSSLLFIHCDYKELSQPSKNYPKHISMVVRAHTNIVVWHSRFKVQPIYHKQKRYLFINEQDLFKLLKLRVEEKIKQSTTMNIINEGINFLKENAQIEKQLNIYQSNLISTEVQGKQIRLEQIQSLIQEQPQTRLLKIIQHSSFKINTDNLTDLNLSNLEGRLRLSPLDVKKLAEIQLPNVKYLNFEKNNLQDQGLKYLCEARYPLLEKINLSDNDITMKGLPHIYRNQWPEKVNYNLYSVKMDENGYQLNIDSSIPTIKSIINNKGKNLDEIAFQGKDKALNAINLYLNTPLDDQNQSNIKKTSNQLYNRSKEKSLIRPKSIDTVIVKLKDQFGDTMKLLKQSNLQSFISTQIIFTGKFNNRVRVQERIKNSELFRFSDFKMGSFKMKEFQNWFYNYLRNKYKIKSQNLILHKITEEQGQIVTSYSLLQGQIENFTQVGQAYFKISKFSPFFECFSLSQHDFDSRGDYSFPKQIQKAQKQWRGGIRYFQPVIGNRLGVRVRGVFQDDHWLEMNGNKQQWSVVFHGVNYPQNLHNNLKIFESIMKGRQKGQMLKQGLGQAYSQSKCFKTGQLVDKGVYTTPYFTTSLFQYTYQSVGGYHLVLQCRAKPSSIKMCSNKNNYWVINNQSDLRPYGIVLFTQQEKRQLMRIPQPVHQSIYKQQITGKTWEDQYKKVYDSFHSS